MAAKVDKKLAAPLLPQAVAVEKKKEKKAPQLPAVQLACQWALQTAAMSFVSFAFAIAFGHYHLTVPSWLCAGGELTDAEERAMISRVLWCSAAAAAAAAPALLLPERLRRSRRALAYVALAAAAAVHLVVARGITLFPMLHSTGIRIRGYGYGDTAIRVAIFAEGDIKCFLALLGRGAYANAPAILLSASA
ncbi:unnamed protein product [Urochloa decumbens]|uniref:Uncharacterized protein n=1 Tax=Urochloa decumbens TaxID=240449 RepID=A0ABC8Z050_9POAL